MLNITLSVFFEEPFYVGLVEEREGQRLKACKHVFGAEPSDEEVRAWLLSHFFELRFSPSVEGAKEAVFAENPKRRQRQAAKAQSAGIGTKSQQALQLAREAGNAARKLRSRELREAEAAYKFQLQTAKRKAKHRGH